MPTYEYSCPKCGKFEQFHSITTSLTKCPKCDSPVKRLISKNDNIIFKGSGFHVTDYRSSDYTQKAKSENSGSSAATTSSAKSESKAS